MPARMLSKVISSRCSVIAFVALKYGCLLMFSFYVSVQVRSNRGGVVTLATGKHSGHSEMEQNRTIAYVTIRLI